MIRKKSFSINAYGTGLSKGDIKEEIEYYAEQKISLLLLYINLRTKNILSMVDNIIS